MAKGWRTRVGGLVKTVGEIDWPYLLSVALGIGHGMGAILARHGASRDIKMIGLKLSLLCLKSTDNRVCMIKFQLV